MYGALTRRDAQYEGIFVVGVKTTGIFCRPSCSARKPKPGNVEYFAGTRDALLAGYRPCKRCRPLEPVDATPQWLRPLVVAVEAEPERRWRDEQLRQMGIEPARARRWFQRHHGMTFHAYCRARRLGSALGRLHQGDDVLRAGQEAGYASDSGFREAFGKHFGASPGRARSSTRILVTRLSTPLGPMIAGATDDAMCLLEFADRRMLATQVDRLCRRLEAHMIPGDNAVLARAQTQLGEYFAGGRQRFDVPLALPGTEFQRAVWAELQTIPLGDTRSYAEQARRIGRPEAVRAVGRANGDNRVAIIVPCHRVVGSGGQLVGYGGQVWRKRALLELEAGRPLPTTSSP
ncbi:MAG: methylated-DNA--[protein]-cysteine S-methyltransferase [Deltaproteobacteria bacterium]|nr:methylated-DNA--[protein]-cysteine S-methyltransferase [Deltaproteobacteria bacterium]